MSYDRDSGEIIDHSEARALVAESIPHAMTAQKVGVKREVRRILEDIKAQAAAAGERWYYRWPAKNKDGSKTMVEGPTVKCAQSVARLYGNCTVGCRVIDDGSHFAFEAFFVDLETGYNLMRPYRQRKSQKTMNTDADRQMDQVFQIGASKATRNVITNALESFTDFAMEEAKNSLVEKIGKNLPGSRQRVKDRLQDLRVDPLRVERMVGRKIEEMLAPDIARVVAEMQSVTEGMASPDDLWPIEQIEQAPLSQLDASQQQGLDQFNKPRQTRQKKTAAPSPEEPKAVKPEPPVQTATSAEDDDNWIAAFTLVDVVKNDQVDYRDDAEFAEAAEELMRDAFKASGGAGLDQFFAMNKSTFNRMPPSATVPLSKIADDLRLEIPASLRREQTDSKTDFFK